MSDYISDVIAQTNKDLLAAYGAKKRMNNTIKLVIEIPKDYYEIIKHEVEHNLTDYRPLIIIGNGIPLDNIKAEIRKKHFSIVEKNDFDNGRTYGYDECLSILDNIGKAESEDK